MIKANNDENIWMTKTNASKCSRKVRRLEDELMPHSKMPMGSSVRIDSARDFTNLNAIRNAAIVAALASQVRWCVKNAMTITQNYLLSNNAMRTEIPVARGER